MDIRTFGWFSSWSWHRARIWIVSPPVTGKYPQSGIINSKSLSTRSLAKFPKNEEVQQAEDRAALEDVGSDDRTPGSDEFNSCPILDQ